MARRGDAIALVGKTWWLDFRHHGRRHKVRLGKNISKTVARELAQVTRGQILKGEAGIGGPKPKPAAPTVREYATPWLERITPELAPATMVSYRSMMTNHIVPALGDIPLDALDVAKVKALLADKAQDGFAKNSVQIIRATLSTMLGDAIEDGVLTTNVVQRLNARKKRRRAGKVTQAERAKMLKPLSVPDLGALLEAAQGRENEYIVLLTLADTGMRPGEAMALQWGDLNVIDQTLHVERSVTLGGQIKGTKTDTDRSVELTPRLTAALKHWHATCQMEAMATGRALPVWIFPSPHGGTLCEGTVATRFRRLRGQAKIPVHHRLYDLRHTYASHTLAMGAPITYVSAQLGHSTPAITLSVYSRWIPGPDRLWAKRLQERREFHTGIHTAEEHSLEESALSSGG